MAFSAHIAEVNYVLTDLVEARLSYPDYIATKIDLSVSCRLFELNLIFADKKLQS